jgi:hypothetical protein
LSPSLPSPVYACPHAFRLHILPFGISKLGSSSSDSGGGGGGVAVGCGAAMGPREASGAGVTGLDIGISSEASTCFFSIVGGRSVVECLPIVQGGMERNSSKVRTRGLQHFQPVQGPSVSPRIQKNLGSVANHLLPFCPSWKIGGPG